MKYYFTLQYWRLKREIKGYGINPYLGMVLYTFGFVAVSELIFRKIHQAPHIYPILGLLFINSFSGQIRNESLKIIFPENKYRKIRLLENLLCALPFFLFLIFKKEYVSGGLTLIFSAILSLNSSANKMSFRIPSPFSKNPYEFTVGFRRSFLIILIIYGITFISIYYHNLNLGIFTLAGLFLLCLSFYSNLDPVFYVWIHAQSPKTFLWKKIRTALKYSFWLSLMIVLPLIYFYPREEAIIFITLGVGLLYIVAGVLAVYVNFPAQMTLSQRLQLYFGIFVPPFLLLVIPNFYQQACSRLKIVLHVED